MGKKRLTGSGVFDLAMGLAVPFGLANRGVGRSRPGIRVFFHCLLGTVLAAACVTALLVYPSPSARADTGTATLTVNSISRSSTDSSLTVDATGSASGFVGSPACGVYQDCYMSLTVKYTDGTTADITHVDNIQASDPYTHEFNWSGQSAKITAMQIRIDTPNHQYPIYSAWVPVSDPAPAPSAALTVNSVSRSAADQSLSVDVTGSATGYMGTTACPFGSDCYMTLEFKYSDGTSSDITHVDSIQSSPYPYSHEFLWSGQSQKIAAVQVRVDTPSHTNPIYSDWVPVSDPYTVPSATATVNAIARSATDGSLSLDVTGSASAYYVSPACPSGQDCYMTLEVKYSDGSVGDLTHVDNLQSSPSPYTHEFTWSGQVSKITAVVVRIDTTAHTNAVYAPWVAVSDPAPAPSAALTVNSSARASDSTLTVNATGSASGYVGSPACPAGQDCYMTLEAKHSDGSLADLTHVDNLQSGPFPFVHQFAWSGQSAKVIALVIRIDTTAHTNAIYSDWMPVSDITSQEQTGGPNPAVDNCGCAHADPVNTATGEFYENSTDLTLPGAPSALELTRTYSSVLAQTDGPFGYGSASNLSMALKATGTGTPPASVSISQEQGSVVDFTLNSAGAYQPGPEVHATLSFDSTAGTFTYTRQGTQVFTFNQSGQLLTASGPHGTSTTYTYANGQLNQITASGGRAITLIWSGNHIASATDSAGRTVSYGYDSSGNLTTVTAADGAKTAYGYNGHYLTSLTKPNGGVTSNTYDSANRIVSQTNPDGKTTAFAYSGSATTTTAPDGSQTVETYTSGALASRVTGAQTASSRTTTFAYSQADDLTAETDPLGKTTAHTYDGSGNELTRNDPLGNKTTYTYDTLRDVLTATDPLGRATTNTYDSAGDRLSSTDPAGNKQSWTYNPDGTVKSWTNAAGGVTTYTYDAAGNRTSSTDPNGRTTTIAYNAAEQAVSLAKPAAAAPTKVTLDPLGRVLTSTDPDGNTTTNVYDGDGNLVKTTSPTGAVTAAAYDATDLKTSTTDPNGKTTAYGYDNAGRLVTTTDPAVRTTKTAYDTFGEKASATDANGNTTSYGYDAAGNQTTVTQPSGAVTATAYDADGRKTSVTDADGNITSYGYDSAGELTTSTDPLHRVTTTAYTPDGQTDTLTHPDGSTERYAYDPLGDITSFTDADGKAATYAFDAAGLLTSKSEPGGISTSYAYNAAGERSTSTDANGTVTTYAYDGDGHLTSQKSGTDPTVAYTYDKDGHRTGMADATGASTYAYDPAGQMTAETSGAGTSIGYTYDDAGNLATIAYPGSGRTVTYSHDAAGNMTGLTDWAGHTVTFAYDANGQQTSQTDGNGITQAITHDATGQVTDMAATDTVNTYGHDAAGNLTSVTGTAAGTIAYTANGNGLRTSRTQSGSTSAWTWDTNSALPLLLDDGNQSYIYGPSGTPVLQIDDRNSTPHYLTVDLLGSVRAVTDTGGTVTGTTNYGTYGAVTAATGTQPRLGYTGGWTDPATGLVYLRARDYDPSARQFTSVDPAIDLTRQPYAYAHNAPTQLTDPTGLWARLCGNPSGTSDSSDGTFGGAGGILDDGKPLSWGSQAMRNLDDLLSGGQGQGRLDDLLQAVIVFGGDEEAIGLGELGGTIRSGAAEDVITNGAGHAYPKVPDPRTGETIPFPGAGLTKVPLSDRVPWGAQERGAYIKEWYDRGYITPEGGWAKYDIHHIQPREYGGTNEFDNLVPVQRDIHQQQFNPWWLGYGR